jgi:hypothetical protein
MAVCRPGAAAVKSAHSDKKTRPGAGSFSLRRLDAVAPVRHISYINSGSNQHADRRREYRDPGNQL